MRSMGRSPRRSLENDRRTHLIKSTSTACAVSEPQLDSFIREIVSQVCATGLITRFGSLVRVGTRVSHTDWIEWFAKKEVRFGDMVEEEEEEEKEEEEE